MPYFSAVRWQTSWIVLHDVVETVIHFLARPGDAHAVLRHLQPGSGDPAGVGGFARTKKNLRLEELVHAVDRRRHVRAFRNDIDAVLQQVGRVFAVDLVLGRARESALRLVIPKRIVIELRIERREHRALEFVGVFRDPAAPDVLQVHDERELLAVDPRFVVDVAGRIGQRDRLRA